GIFRSTDGAASWEVFMGGHPNVAVYDLVARSATATILSYTHGRSVFKLGTFCNDGNLCTTDRYDQILGCQHTAASCDDFNACTTATCSPASGCQHTAVTCDDTNVCTSDSCNLASGCVFTPLTGGEAEGLTSELRSPY